MCVREIEMELAHLKLSLVTISPRENRLVKLAVIVTPVRCPNLYQSHQDEFNRQDHTWTLAQLDSTFQPMNTSLNCSLSPLLWGFLSDPEGICNTWAFQTEVARWIDNSCQPRCYSV